ncbi:hypothetical protein [Mycolicibacterium llatzerense]|uniref:hypothetical protein n=1 Tax=Mycolicibacterium llatzerense TaxID=280871 RepID=UPI0021B5B3AC|nr:hypothetical protein [Mycolicibacterium llatzerense]MCT7372732.1 hypothetical protein [Mycolicibacterium llatzerense]
MKRPGPISLPAKYLAVLLGITAGYLGLVVAMARELAPTSILAVFAAVIASLVMGWFLHEAVTEVINHRKLARLRAERARATEEAFGQIAAAVRGATPEQIAAFRRRMGIPDSPVVAAETAEETRP